MLKREEVEAVYTLGDELSIDEVVGIYLPLSRLIELRVKAQRSLTESIDTFLGIPSHKRAFVIGIAGSVGVGKSTTARILQLLLSWSPGLGAVEIVATDGFLMPNAVLGARGLLGRKGFPESYDVPALFTFLKRLRSGDRDIEIPIYSHSHADVIQNETRIIANPDVVIVEGLNILQTSAGREESLPTFLDFSMYLDGDPIHIERWYVKRFLALRRAAASQDDGSYFRKYATLSDDEAIEVAHQKWRTINAVNLRRNIEPTRRRAHLILRKSADHRVSHICLQRL